MYVKMVSKTKVLYYSLILILLFSKNKVKHMFSHNFQNRLISGDVSAFNVPFPFDANHVYVAL